MSATYTVDCKQAEYQLWGCCRWRKLVAVGVGTVTADEGRMPQLGSALMLSVIWFSVPPVLIGKTIVQILDFIRILLTHL